MHKEMPHRVTSVMRSWYWIWLISAVLVGVMYAFFLTKYPAWLHYSYRGVSLSHEMSYGVWWSAICLTLAALIFANVGSIVFEDRRTPWPWVALSVGMLALACDEVGSLHETVARAAGWEGLLPFALLFLMIFGYAVVALLQNRASRVVAVMVMIGLGMFGSVVALELLEHDYSFQHPFWRRARQVGEEAIELIAMGILISAALVAMRRMGDGDRSVRNATRVVSRLLDYPMMVFIVFLLHTLVTVAVIIPNYTFFPEGNPSALFPMLMFFALGLIAMQRSVSGQHQGFWKLLCIVFIITSMTQLYNAYVLLENLINPDPIHSPIFVNVFGYDVRLGRIFAEPPVSWMIGLTGVLILWYHGWRKGEFSIKQLVMPMLVLLILYALVHPDLDLRFRLEYLSFLFSGFVAWIGYRLMVELPR